LKRTRNILVFIGVVIIVIVLSWFALKGLKEKKIIEEEPVEWTVTNSLTAIPPPDSLKDSKSDTEPLLKALENSLKYYDKCNPDRSFNFGHTSFSLKQLQESLIEFMDKLKEYGLTETFFDYIKTNFSFYQTAVEEVLVTGYFEAQLNGSLTKSDTYKYPLYKKPADMLYIRLSSFPHFKGQKGLPNTIKGRMLNDSVLVPYYSREEIDVHRKLANRNCEIVWIDNYIDVFFLQIQGSGVVTLDNGDIMRVNYAESNGHPYRAIGTLLIQQEILTRENISMQSIRKYLEENPEKVDEVLNYNPSYVFFRKVEEGPLGSLGLPVTAFRSIATDKKIFPEGALCYIETEIPLFDERDSIECWKKFQGFVLNQDTGGAIKTPGRLDLFTGYGKMSELIAGHMKQKGRLFFLVKKSFE
jgi:membrane-bound lytic murein transglycosylase A